jgi:2-phosphoglycerate kinase
MPLMNRHHLPAEELRDRLSHVRFIGGGSGGGKSTVAHRLAATHGLQLYQTEQFSRYVERTTPAEAPLLHAFQAMDMDERWLNRSPQIMFDTFHGFHGEGFDLVIADLLALPRQPPILVEGFTLLPRLVAPLLSGPGQAIWLLPTPEFRRAAFDSRGSTWDIAEKTSDPDRALDNLLTRDRLFTDHLRREATTLDLTVIEVDLSLSIDELVNRVGAVLDLAPPPSVRQGA